MLVFLRGDFPGIPQWQLHAIDFLFLSVHLPDNQQSMGLGEGAQESGNLQVRNLMLKAICVFVWGWHYPAQEYV